MRINGCHISVCIVAALCLACQAAFGYTLDWTANSLNQYTEFTHDADGNMTQCGDWTYTYDAANRLKTVSSNGVLLVTNFYDAKSHRVKKVTPDATMTFFYDGWNLIEERIAYTNGTSSTIHYYWGKDLSGTLQGAGGVGGLLYLTIDGVPYIPDYDNIGNITRYLDVNGNVVAQYTYDAFGGTVSQSGTMCGVFRHRFSTKYLDIETSLYYYGYRFYSPSLMRWLNRDPMQERGGLNLYSFCENQANFNYDVQGCMLSAALQRVRNKISNLKDRMNSVFSSATECIKVVNEWRPGHVRDSDANDKYRHCVASCEIANACGDKLSLALGIIKEIRDLSFGLPQNMAGAADSVGVEAWLNSVFNGDSYSASIEDLAADVIGIDLKNAKGGCRCACKQYYAP